MENHITDTGGLITDAAVILALSFLDKTGAPKLRKHLETLVEDGRLVLTQGPALVSGGIGMDSDEAIPSRAWSVLKGLLRLAAGNINDAEMAGFETAFGEFRAGKENFDIDDAAPGLRLTVISIENTFKTASNEGGIEFLPEAYKTMWDLSVIDEHEVSYKYAADNVTDIFFDVCKNVRKKNKIDDRENFLPRGPVLIKRLSNGVLPTVKEMENGTILINKNFVKVMGFLFDKMHSFEGGGGIYLQTGRSRFPKAGTGL